MNKELLLLNALANEAYNMLDHADEVLMEEPKKTLFERYMKVEKSYTDMSETMSDSDFKAFIIKEYGEDYIEDVFKHYTDVAELEKELKEYKVKLNEWIEG